MSLNLRALGQRDPTKYVEWLSWQGLLETNNRRGKKKEWNYCAWNYPIRMYFSESLFISGKQFFSIACWWLMVLMDNGEQSK